MEPWRMIEQLFDRLPMVWKCRPNYPAVNNTALRIPKHTSQVALGINFLVSPPHILILSDKYIKDMVCRIR